LGQGEVIDPSAAVIDVGRTTLEGIKRRVMPDDDMPVGAESDVELDT
jgi:hypothetical protein